MQDSPKGCLLKTAHSEKIFKNRRRIIRGTRSVAGRFAVVAAMVLGCGQLAGFGVDGDALSIGPMAVSCFEAIPLSLQGFHRFRGEAWLQVELVGQVLVMKSRSIDGLLDVQTALRCGEEDVGDAGDDARAAR